MSKYESTEFDWSGAPEGERWVWCDVRLVTDGQLSWVHAYGEWQPSVNSADFIREHGTRVESARPVPREASSSGAADHRLSGRSGTPTVNVGDRVRVTIEGDVQRVGPEDGSISFRSRRGGSVYVWPETDGAQVEVLERADPPLQPGDLVRDADGLIYVLHGEDTEHPFCLLYNRDGDWDGSTWYPRDKLIGPLVKVQLTEVHDA